MTEKNLTELELILSTNSPQFIVDWYRQQNKETQVKAMKDERLFLALFRWLSPELQDEFLAEVQAMNLSHTEFS